MPRGGRRPGAGRKPKPKVLVPQFGPPGVLPVLAPPTTNEIGPIEEFDAPDSLGFEERQVWMKQAPHAFRMRTLTKATAMAFERYCRMVAREAVEAKSSAAEGANHRGLRREIGVLELQFLLAPAGRAVVEPSAAGAPAVGALARFRS